jgi:hypoxanthine phosphoribosyltransferase
MGIAPGREWKQDLASVLLTESQIEDRVQELAAELAAEYRDKHPLLIGVLKGSVVSLSDLMRALCFPLEIDLVCCESYGKSFESSGEVHLRLDLSHEVCDRHVILVEDIVDTGLTLSWLRDRLCERGPAPLSICCLLSKPSRRKAPLTPEYVGFEIPDEFVVGYGLDYAERYRWLPYVAVLRPEVYK